MALHMIQLTNEALPPNGCCLCSAIDARPEFGTDIRQWKVGKEAGGYYWNNNADTADDDTDKWYFRNRKRHKM
jgi:hypothetical protein